ncbi:hypothetical protein GQ54DRAFT_297392 [Martensiomyces pterosporus]|nr:hypothetical protein GQ54DRAFT_297392 [Martensiomyces pterosporus]
MLGVYSWRYHAEKDDGRVDLNDTALHKTLAERARWYLKVVGISTVMLWAALSLFYGCVHKRGSLVNNIKVQVIDLDGGEVGANITRMVLDTPPSNSLPTWEKFDGVDSIDAAKTWVRRNGWGALVINSGLTKRLNSALYNGEEYNSTKALTLLVSTGRQAIAELMFVQSALTEVPNAVRTKYSLQLISQFRSLSAEQKAGLRTNHAVLFDPLHYTKINVAPDNYPIAPVATTFGYLVCTLCTLPMLISCKFSSFPIFQKVKYRHLVPMWITLIFCWSLTVSLYYSLAFLAFKGPDYKWLHQGLAYTAGRFFSIWFSATAVVMVVALWLFMWFLNLPPCILALPSLLTVLPNVVSCINPMELAPRFYRFFYALPFYNGTKIMKYITTGAYPRLGLNIGVLLGEVAVMMLALSASIWLRQYFVLQGMSDFHGWYRGTIFFHSPVPYYRQQCAEPSGDGESTVHITDDDDSDDDVSLRTGNLGV